MRPFRNRPKSSEFLINVPKTPDWAAGHAMSPRRRCGVRCGLVRAISIAATHKAHRYRVAVVRSRGGGETPRCGRACRYFTVDGQDVGDTSEAQIAAAYERLRAG